VLGAVSTAFDCRQIGVEFLLTPNVELGPRPDKSNVDLAVNYFPIDVRSSLAHLRHRTHRFSAGREHQQRLSQCLPIELSLDFSISSYATTCNRGGIPSPPFPFPLPFSHLLKSQSVWRDLAAKGFRCSIKAKNVNPVHVDNIKQKAGVVY